MSGGRPRKPIALHNADKKKHMGKEEREVRAQCEVTMGRLVYTAPDAVKKNPEATKKWKEVISLYKSAKTHLVTSSDNGVIGRYCLAYAEYLELVEIRRKLNRVDMPENDDILYEIADHMDEEFGKRRANKLWDLFNGLLAVDGILKLDKSINAKLKVIMDLENKLFLNPLAKIRSIPLDKPQEKPDPAKETGFDV